MSFFVAKAPKSAPEGSHAHYYPRKDIYEIHIGDCFVTVPGRKLRRDQARSVALLDALLAFEAQS